MPQDDPDKTPPSAGPRDSLGKKTMWEMSKTMMGMGDKADERVAEAYKEGLSAVVSMAEKQQAADERRSALQFRIFLALILILGAVSMGAGAVKLFGVFEIGESSSEPRSKAKAKARTKVKAPEDTAPER